MKPWQLTTGLATAAVAAALLAPRLHALWTPPVPVVPEAVPAPRVAIAEIPEAAQGMLTVTADFDKGALHADRVNERYLSITVTAPDDWEGAERPPVNLSVVIDKSGSMKVGDKIVHARAAARQLAGNMRPGDTFGLITFDSAANVVVPNAPVLDLQRIGRQIDRIHPGGNTNLHAGMQLGIEQVGRHLQSGEVGRMLILSDGQATAGITDPGRLAAFASDAARAGITVSAFGVGVDYNEDLLGQMADQGGGTYAHVEDPALMQVVFREELERATAVVASSAYVDIELPEGVELIQGFGIEPTATDAGWRVFLGDLPAGSTRTMVARVRVSSHPVGTHSLAEIHASAVDARVPGEVRSTTDAVATGEFTLDRRRVRSSTNVEAATAATLVVGNTLRLESATAHARGDQAGAEELARQSEAVFEDFQSESGVDMSAEVDDLQRQNQMIREHAPTTTAGKRAIKTMKEESRARTR